MHTFIYKTNYGMKVLNIDGWYGRFGNNIITLLNAVVYCLQNDFDVIKFAEHSLFNTDHILLSTVDQDQCTPQSQTIPASDVYFMRINNKIVYHITEREVFDIYIRNILRDELVSDQEKQVNGSLVFYLRGEDLFRDKIQAYPQPPLYFYKQILQVNNKNKALMISQDLLNPVANYMYHSGTCDWRQQEFKRDLYTLLHCESLSFAYSTLLVFVLLCSKQLQTIYVPKYVDDEFYKTYKFKISELLSASQTLILIDIPNYIDKPVHTAEEYEFMISYTPNV